MNLDGELVLFVSIAGSWGLTKGAQKKDGMEGLENREVPTEVCVFKADSGYSMGKGKKRWEKPVPRLLLDKRRDTGHLD